MKRPTWATIVGILGIVFGCFGILGGGQEMFMPKMMEMQKEMFTAFQKAVPQKQPDAMHEIIDEIPDPSQEKKRSIPNFPPAEMFEMMQKMWEVPSWFASYSISVGIAKALISAFYLLASIWLLQLKPISIRLFYCAAGLSIALCIVKGIVTLTSLSFMGVAMMFGGAFGAFIDIILIIVVLTGDKEAFAAAPPPLPR